MINGCTDYVTMSVDIYFEPGHVACQYCPLMTTYSRNQCMKTGELLLDPKTTVGRWCPLYKKEKK